ncbi:MAG: hypothetical protein Q4D42_01310 [Eubacteriales bacterium]|nr:hypothetical protein [Eubacteriales bacterium]
MKKYACATAQILVAQHRRTVRKCSGIEVKIPAHYWGLDDAGRWAGKKEEAATG